MKPRRSVYERLSGQRALIGLLQTQPSLVFPELAGVSGYDFLFLDGEHGILSDSDILHILQVLAATDVLAMVRLAKQDAQAVGRYLDMGADAIVVPNVSTAEQAKMLARGMEYPPAGTRGFGASLHRATRYGLDTAMHLNAPRAGAAFLSIIESALGVTNADEILAVEGVDGVIVGAFDLSVDLGCAGDFTQPAFVQAVERIERAARACGKLLGTAPNPAHPIETCVARGHSLLIVGADVALLRGAMSAQVTAAKVSIDASSASNP